MTNATNERHIGNILNKINLLTDNDMLFVDNLVDNANSLFHTTDPFQANCGMPLKRYIFGPCKANMIRKKKK